MSRCELLSIFETQDDLLGINDKNKVLYRL